MNDSYSPLDSSGSSLIVEQITVWWSYEHSLLFHCTTPEVSRVGRGTEVITTLVTEEKEQSSLPATENLREGHNRRRHV